MREGNIDDTPQVQFKNQLRRLRVSHQTFVSSINGCTLWILINFRLLAMDSLNGFIALISIARRVGNPLTDTFISVIGYIELIHCIDALRKRRENERTNEQIFHRFSMNPIVFLYMYIYIYVYIFFLRANEWAHNDE